MTVTIRATGSLRSRVGSDTILEDVSTVGDAVDRLGLEQITGMAILVNGRIAHWGSSLQNGDVIQLIPQLAGGQESLPRHLGHCCLTSTRPRRPGTS
jgi:molybdopterin converting factor small subunit